MSLVNIVNRYNVGEFFIFLSLTIGIISYLFCAFIFKFRPSPGFMMLILIHLFITLITYWLSFRKDITNINENRFSRTLLTVGLFAVVPIVLVILVFIDPYQAQSAAFLYLIFSPIGISFSSIALAAFISIIIWRKKTQAKLWQIDTVLILIASLFFFSFSLLAILIVRTATLS
jgi:hypothetical protein